MRIAALAPSVTRMLQELGAAGDIVACTTLCPLEKEERQAKAVGTFSVLHEERIAQAKPDLVVTATLVQAKGAARLESAGYRVLHLDPRRLSQIAESYAILGDWVGREQRGRRLKAQFLGKLEELATRFLRGAPDEKRSTVYMEEWHEPPYVAGNWVPDIVAAAGGRAALIQPGEPSREVTLDELREADPDVIIQHVCLPPLLPEHGVAQQRQRTRQREQMREQLGERPGWNSLRAMTEGNVYSVDDALFNMPTLQALPAIEIVREVLQEVRQPMRR